MFYIDDAIAVKGFYTELYGHYLWIGKVGKTDTKL